ncbi:hypothetical protein DdX_13140 [Ditylenchus destructor]|uniref:Uncharacterized protein n=1 Tax=Ditylenchus destructor TaxID=166010 RepID=A0AAD4MZH3_9BILA|nr:hypothetical protein DdX_13140 [Ditylenchus destructor]
MSYANILAFVEHLPYVENGVAVATRYAGHPVAKALFTAAGCGALTYFAFAEGALVVAFFSNPVVWVATGVGLAAGAISYKTYFEPAERMKKEQALEQFYRVSSLSFWCSDGQPRLVHLILHQIHTVGQILTYMMCSFCSHVFTIQKKISAIGPEK